MLAKVEIPDVKNVFQLQYCVSDKPAIKPFEPEMIAVQDYPITEMQPVYFLADSFESAQEKLK